jgi:hypothetical protein
MGCNLEKPQPNWKHVCGGPRVERSMAFVARPTYLRQTHKPKNKKKDLKNPPL